MFWPVLGDVCLDGHEDEDEDEAEAETSRPASEMPGKMGHRLRPFTDPDGIFVNGDCERRMDE